MFIKNSRKYDKNIIARKQSNLDQRKELNQFPLWIHFLQIYNFLICFLRKVEVNCF